MQSEDVQIYGSNTESIKLIKNTKGYSWEIKVFEKDWLNRGTIDRLKQLDNALKENFK